MLLNQRVSVNGLSRGSFFGVRMGNDDKLHFYKKNTEITAVDRILTKYYDAAISHMNAMPGNVLAALPKNVFFGMDYAPVGDAETAAPRKCLKLAYAQIIDAAGTATNVDDVDALNKWADTLNVDRPDIFFSGQLNQEQKAAVLDFAYTPQAELAKNFRSRSFTKYLLGVLGCPDAPADIDGVVFRFYDDGANDTTAVLAKIIDPMIAAIPGDERGKKPNDYVYLIVIDVLNFIESYDTAELMSVTDRNKSFEDNYVALIDKVYVEFIDRFKSKYVGLEIDIPEFMRTPEFELNVEKIRSEKVRDLVGICASFAEIYKIMLNFFRHKKTRPRGIFSNEIMLQFNNLVDKIKKVVIGADVNESYFPTFYQYVNTISEEFDYVSTMNTRQRYAARSKRKRVNIIVDEFQPVSDEHVAAAKAMYAKNRLRTVFVIIRRTAASEKYPFGEETVKRLTRLVAGAHGDVVADVVVTDANAIGAVISALQPNYLPVLWAAPKTRINDYVLQLDFAKKKKLAYNIDNGFKLIELPVNSTCKRIIGLVSEGKYHAFCDYVPKQLHSEFFNMKREIDSAAKTMHA